MAMSGYQRVDVGASTICRIKYVCVCVCVCVGGGGGGG